MTGAAGRHRAPEPEMDEVAAVRAVGRDVGAKNAAVRLLRRVAAGSNCTVSPADAVQVVDLVDRLFQLLGDTAVPPAGYTTVTELAGDIRDLLAGEGSPATAQALGALVGHAQGCTRMSDDDAGLVWALVEDVRGHVELVLRMSQGPAGQPVSDIGGKGDHDAGAPAEPEPVPPVAGQLVRVTVEGTWIPTVNGGGKVIFQDAYGRRTSLARVTVAGVLAGQVTALAPVCTSRTDSDLGVVQCALPAGHADMHWDKSGGIGWAVPAIPGPHSTSDGE